MTSISLFSANIKAECIKYGTFDRLESMHILVFATITKHGLGWKKRNSFGAIISCRRLRMGRTEIIS